METDKVLPGTYKTLPVDPSADPDIHAVSKNEPGDYADSGANKSENDGSTSSGDDSFESLSYEEAMSKYGSGRYQVIIFILLSLVTFSCVFNNNGYIFIGATQEHYCKVPESSNWTDFNNKTAVLVYTADTCTYNKWARYRDEVDGNITEVMIEEDIKCYSWVYDKSFFDLTIMSEWDINSCTGKWKIALASSMYMLGFLIGCIFLADLSDRYGRSKLLLVSNICMVVIGVIASFSVNFWMLAIMRLLLGIFTAGARNAGFVYVCEIIKERSAAGMLHGVTYSIGGVAVTAIAHLFPHWRHFQLACALCYILYIPYYWIMEESPRWLLSQGRTEEALAYFKKSARINKVEFPENLHVYLEYQVCRRKAQLLLPMQ
ncbi:Orct [Bugula neritina]|uniref:Orct n=1 Tax=Bugula neritina TaxID=10212 RepID=A0A7J7K5W5_BUGNE|nr:Orct [Bugula neritina]